MSKNLHADNETWEAVLTRRLPLLGHRNWIVVADAAYPAQSNPGIETIATGADHLQVLARVLLVAVTFARTSFWMRNLDLLPRRTRLV